MELVKIADITSAEEASKILDKTVSDAMKLVRHAEKIATKFELEFSFNVAYGMGGYFYGYDPRVDWYGEDELEEMKADGCFPDPNRIGWQSSSSNC
jgi:hypothetical protein